jgi:hypothetical protein
MIPDAFRGFFAASTGAGAALIGLLFVAISIGPERTVMAEAPIERRILATGTFVALVDAFLVSLYALVPGSSLGWPTAAVGVGALYTTVRFGSHLMRAHAMRAEILRQVPLFVGSVVIYGWQTYAGVVLIRNPQETDAVYAIAYLLVAGYVIGLGRAWQLLGAERMSLLGSLFRDSAQQRAAEKNAKPAPPGANR